MTKAHMSITPKSCFKIRSYTTVLYIKHTEISKTLMLYFDAGKQYNNSLFWVLCLFVLDRHKFSAYFNNVSKKRTHQNGVFKKNMLLVHFFNHLILTWIPTEFMVNPEGPRMRRCLSFIYITVLWTVIWCNTFSF